MPLTQEQDDLEHKLRVDLMKVQTENFKVQLTLEPWKLLALGIGAGAALMGAAVGIATFILRAAGVGG